MQESILSAEVIAELKVASTRLAKACDEQSKRIVEADDRLATMLCHAGVIDPLPELVVQKSAPKTTLVTRRVSSGYRVQVEIDNFNPDGAVTVTKPLTGLDVRLRSKVLPRLEAYAQLLAHALAEASKTIEEQLK